jgi:hypothetical protein
MVASLAMGVAAFAVDRGLGDALSDGRLLSEVIRLVMAIASAVGVLAVTAFLLGIREFHLAIASITGRFQSAD